MKLSHSFTAHITPETFITSYNNGECQCCSFIDDGETVTIGFGTDCLTKLTETIRTLQQIQQSLSQKRQQQISQELELLNPPINLNGNGKHQVEVDIAF